MNLVKSFFGLIGLVLLVFGVMWLTTIFTYAGYRVIAPELGWTVPEFWAVFWSLIWFSIAAAIPSTIWIFVKEGF